MTLIFLVAGVVAATFEFYAAGPGVTAVASVLAFLLAGYGLATLPMSWLSVAGVLVGMLLYTWDFQRNQLSWRSVVGTVVLLVSGMTLTAARPQFAPTWWIVLVVVAGAALFYGIGLTSIVRSRFSITAISRGYLIGRSGTAEATFDPDGFVMVDGGRWPGRADLRENIAAGTPVEVTGVDGVVLEVSSIQTA
jgi:membrane-bound ClpP family serine protease